MTQHQTDNKSSRPTPSCVPAACESRVPVPSACIQRWRPVALPPLRVRRERARLLAALQLRALRLPQRARRCALKAARGARPARSCCTQRAPGSEAAQCVARCTRLRRCWRRMTRGRCGRCCFRCLPSASGASAPLLRLARSAHELTLGTRVLCAGRRRQQSSAPPCRVRWLLPLPRWRYPTSACCRQPRPLTPWSRAFCCRSQFRCCCLARTCGASCVTPGGFWARSRWARLARWVARLLRCLFSPWHTSGTTPGRWRPRSAVAISVVLSTMSRFQNIWASRRRWSPPGLLPTT